MSLMKIVQGKANTLELESEYSYIAPLASRFADELSHQLQQLLDNNLVYLSFPIQLRVKSWQSISEKLQRKSFSINKINELNDLVGLRLILQFKRDIDKVCSLINTNFEVIEQYDTSERLRADQFGYSSIHFIIELPEKWLSVPTLAKMKGLRAEIQVRTTAQHIWAAASHTLQYKHEESVPPPIRRAIHRVSALLETVDLEFERVLEERETYREEPINVQSDEILNVDLLEKTIDSILPLKNKVDDEMYADLLEDLINFKINTPKMLLEILNKHKDKVLLEDAEMVQEQLSKQDKMTDEFKSRLSAGVFYFHVGLVRRIMANNFGEKWKTYMKAKNNKINKAA